MFFTFWNSSLLAVAVCILCLTKGSQPRFHAVIMLITGLLGTQLHKISSLGTWVVGLGVIVFFNFVTLALSPLQLVLAWCLTPKSPINPGITVLHNGDEKGNITVDIVAVHGLGSNPDWAWTWEDQAKKCMWLKDLLPKSIPRARIMTYNHNSAWFRDAPVKSIKICGEELLEALNTERSHSKEAQQRPIIFIGHNFGGIIIKQALVVASEKFTDATFDSIEKSMHGAIFLGVPHDGSQLTYWGEVLSYCTYWLGSSTELLEALQPGAESLRELNRSFFTNYGQRDLVDFFETQKTKAMGVPVLLGVNTHASTNLGVKRVALVTDNVGMNKFRSETHMNYRLVLGQLTRMVDKIEKEQLKSLSAEQHECLKSLYVVGSDNRRESIEKAHPSTLEWLDQSPGQR
ncbi:uncharacterized protein LAJ45_08793 [Morchella importuna]|uniref:uncharacterized protein n=1 Tax=Morchella importuna TaxID=1174673 RepID=UPI001E8D0C86|nr:uncharacterized protein LAJ45_08793 [Morchella importuna]KAH8147315.1 hypothetical protein LAJ45_08793 [Morchella importuna]